MPGQILRDPTPTWLRPSVVTGRTPGQANIVAPEVIAAIRWLAGLIGADDPQSQVMGLMNPMEVGPSGGVAGAVQKLLQRVQKPIKAYHGSPHDFDQFSLEKIGTGEGAQAYGHGLYFAENPNTADAYKRVLGGREFKVKGRRLVASSGGSSRALDQQTRGQTIAADALDDAFNAQSSAPAQFAANRLRNQRRYYPEEAEHIDEALNIIADWQQSGETQKLTGRMYEVNIHADPDTLLDWDKPLSQQSEHVRNALARAPQPKTPLGKDKLTELRGADVYEGIGKGLWWNKQARLSDKKAAASEALRKAGIPGMKYFDQGSRTAGEGTRNFVIFDDSLVEILKKYGVALPVIENLRQMASRQGGLLQRGFLPPEMRDQEH